MTSNIQCKEITDIWNLYDLVEICKKKKGYKNAMSKEEIPQAEWRGYEQALNEIIKLLEDFE